MAAPAIRPTQLSRAYLQRRRVRMNHGVRRREVESREGSTRANVVASVLDMHIHAFAGKL